MDTVIIGKESLLTKHLKAKNKKAIIFSSRNKDDIKIIINFINSSKSKVNIIFNNFYPSALINQMDRKSYDTFYNQSILFNANIFSQVIPQKINKIIYSSSSAVYNSIRKDYQFIDTNNKSLYSSTKIAAENLIYNFCSKNKISFLILRIFNMYSDKDDKFSIISKLVKAINKKKEVKIFNGGENIRDYINVKDVVKLYNYFINKKKLKNSVYDIGVGRGVKLIDLIEFVGSDNFKLKKINKSIDEVDISIATNDYLKKFDFISLEKYFSRFIKTKNSLLNRYHPRDNNLLQDIIDGHIIYGTGNAGKQVYSAFLSQNQNVYCFVDDDKKKHNKYLYGKKIISQKELEHLSKIKIVKSLIISIPTLTEKKLKNIKETFSQYINEVSFLPLKTTLKSKIISLTDLNNIATDEILGKKKRIINYKNFEKQFKNKNILVTGAAGSIGSQLVRQLLNTQSKNIICYDNSEIDLFNFKNELKNFNYVKFNLGDILDENFLSYIVKKEKIDIIFHAAAYKHVGILQDNIQSAIRNNIFGTQSVLNVAKKNRVKIITISTDKAVKPTSILGFTKRIAEILCLIANQKDFSSKVVRFGNVFGSIGSAVPTFINQINKKLPITITNKNVKRFFMTTNEACFLLMSSLKIQNVDNVLVLNMGKPIKILDIINSLIKMRKKIEPNYIFEIKEIGLTQGEKMNEQLTVNKRLIKTNNPDISIVTDPKYEKEKIDELLEKLQNNIEPIISAKIMKNFLNKDFK
jgi:FlaA1/EpsC-like NDP-sugar epimerase